MKEIIINSHKERSPPSTHNRNRTRKPIDSIWASIGVKAVSCGFLPFHDEKGFYSDHRLVWVDFCNESLLGHRPQRIFRAPRSKVKSNNPISREKYNDRTKKMYIKEEIIEEYKTFQEFCKAQREGIDLMTKIESTYENISYRSFKIRKKVDKKLSKYFNGAHPYSPKLQQARDRVKL